MYQSFRDLVWYTWKKTEKMTNSQFQGISPNFTPVLWPIIREPWYKIITILTLFWNHVQNEPYFLHSRFKDARPFSNGTCFPDTTPKLVTGPPTSSSASGGQVGWPEDFGDGRDRVPGVTTLSIFMTVFWLRKGIPGWRSASVGGTASFLKTPRLHWPSSSSDSILFWT